MHNNSIESYFSQNVDQNWNIVKDEIWSNLAQIDPKWYQYNGKAGHEKDGREYVGLIAQEIQKVLPYTVSSRLGKLEETDTEEIEILKLDASALVYVLINAVKELDAKVQSLEKELKAK